MNSGPDRIAYSFTQDLIDLRLCRGINPPASYFINRQQLFGMTRAPQRRGDALVKHPADRQVDNAPAEASPRQLIDFLHGGQILGKPGPDKLWVGTP